MNLRALQSLVAIAEGGSFQQAAQRLGLSQSAVSMQIKALEERLGRILVDRASRPLRLSECGEAVLREARAMLEALARIEALAEGTGDLAGTLFLGVIPTASTTLLPQALKALKTAHPRLGIRVESGLSGELTQKLAQGTLDAAIVTAPQTPDPAFARHLLVDEPLVLIDLPGEGDPVDLDTARGRPFIRFNRRAGVGEVIDRLLGQLGTDVETAMELDSIDAITRMVAEGLGIAIVPRSTLSPAMARRLRILPIDHPAARRWVVLLHEPGSRKARLIAPLVTALQNF